MRALKPLILSLSCLIFLLAGCSMEPGGSEDPADFKTSLTPVGAGAAMDDARLAAIESALEAATRRIDTLEQEVTLLEKTMATIEMTAQEALDRAEEHPMAGINLDDEAAVGRELMEQSLEQIIGISRLLLDKIEDKIGTESQQTGEPQDTAAEQPATPNAAAQDAAGEDAATEAQ